MSGWHHVGARIRRVIIRDGVKACREFRAQNMQSISKGASMKVMIGVGHGKKLVSLELAAAVLFLAAIGILGRVQAGAQTAVQAAEIVKPLSSHTHEVVSRLTELDRLPAEEWRFHAGDLAHGESPDLDDSSWQVLKARAETSQEAVWFRRWIEVPQDLHGYDLTGARIWFSFSASANGPMPEIIYFNGRRVALGDDLEPIVLFDKAQPGDKVLVAVKLLHTVDKKTFARNGTEDRFC